MKQTLKVTKGSSLKEIIHEYKLKVSMPCNGNHTCGKCKIKVIEGNLAITETETKVLSEAEIQEGIRLACVHNEINEDITIQTLLNVDDFQIVGNKVKQYESYKEKGYGIAIDIGTTTVVINVVDLYNAKVIQEYSFINPQTKYGSDVISRIQACNEYTTQAIQRCLLDEIETLLAKIKVRIKRMCVCGNSVMTHIFMNEDPTSIGLAPYTCNIKEDKTILSNMLFPSIDNVFPVEVIHGISAFVGSDIVMGMYAINQLENENSLFIDLGTNGEITLNTNKHIYTSSAACGPAFEGGNMECGVGAIKGAISKFTNGSSSYETIKGEDAIGICGSGYMSLIYELLCNNTLETSGYLEEDIQISKDIKVTQKDIREFQLAKSSMASAIVCLCEVSKMPYQAIHKVFLAGGFGLHVDIEYLIELGIIPELLKDKIEVVGNSAIQGIVEYTIKQDKTKINEIINISESITLSNNVKFSEQFMQNVIFETI